MKEKYILNIKAEERRGLLHLLTGTIEKRQVIIHSLSSASTDVHGVLMITIEIFATERELMTLSLKLENIVEVFQVEVTQYDKALCLRAAYFKMSKAFMESPQLSVMQKYNATVVNFYADSVLIAKYGCDSAIKALYNQLEGPHLLGFIQSGLISDTTLIDSDEDRVIHYRHIHNDNESLVRISA